MQQSSMRTNTSEIQDGKFTLCDLSYTRLYLYKNVSRKWATKRLEYLLAISRKLGTSFVHKIVFFLPFLVDNNYFTLFSSLQVSDHSTD